MNTESEAPRVKVLTTGNWLEPDPVMRGFVGLIPATGEVFTPSADDWARRFLEIDLPDGISADTRDLFAVARGTFVYGYFFYPLYVLGQEQLYRVADAALLYAYRHYDGPRAASPRPPSYCSRVEWLASRGILTEAEAANWKNLVELRNMGSHPHYQRIGPPTDALSRLTNVARVVGELFERMTGG